EATDEPAAVVTQELSEAETRELIDDVPEIYHTRTEEVLLAALVETLSYWTGARRVKVEVKGNGRDELRTGVDVTRTEGWFATIYPVVLATIPGASTGERLKQIKEQVRAVPQSGIGYGVLRYLRQTLSPGAEAEISFNYHGQLDQVWAQEGFSAGEIHNHEEKPRHKIE